ncbi:recombination protein RecR [bacterium (Candidatus Gribaldobacteria) CG_4_10_14_0_2_um_filter_41_16]|uniref:Recombination protein RecR n=3 Tax=Candidatus Gribaldobacteria TaxID=2798536 RepID=A0A2M7VHG4_9BACT|nr:MAG: recombination protein RecR [Parcubacteria group bacterium CG1_02_41_26]PIR91652.1 MAG: recombination protein RecR [bacterium (Candidatus Gribaldobacteria) CG10_big_fil_rev_8_21_14_0_10_41_12]PIX03283.1 MAG: recombination protein RecR [bacterium (Candidatus Gribaldobacteria) CG_4_8_14_3_um_filter_42_11]PJA01213.1 MAG: recombination protein RecR [bacterium (Candidatus Gribaldobacteria) CG_4_10_14_0_2_um_filter_41_16]
MLPPAAQKLVDLFIKFPTVGRRTAQRFAFYLIKSDQSEVDNLLEAIKNLKNKIKLCDWCGKSYETEQQTNGLCAICSDSQRDQAVVCVIEKEVDLETIEKTGQFKGLYFIWDANNEEQQLKNLIVRIKKSAIKEIILALDPTLEGRQLALKIQRSLETIAVKLTQLGRGLPVGGEIEYADQETITSALEGRK